MAKVETERFFGKKGIIIMIRDGNKMVSAIFKDKKNADKFNRNKPADVKKLLQLAKKTKFPKAIDEGPKRYNQKDGVGKSKYVISYHDGKKKHKDGSDFFDIQIFRNKKDLAKFVNALHRGGYKYGFGEGIGEDTDVGHQDDEPNMLKSTALEIMEYGKKLMDKLDKYDDMEGEVDFPNWWQSKLTLARDYVSKAYHYLDSEEKTSETIDRSFRTYRDDEGDDEGPVDEAFVVAYGKGPKPIKPAFAAYADKKMAQKFMADMKRDGFKVMMTQKKIRGIDESNLNECWDTHKQVGFKMKNGKRVPNCVPKNEIKEDKNQIVQLKKKVGKSEIKFYDALSKIEKKLGKKKYRAFLEKGLKDFKINAKHYDYRSNGAAEEKLFQLAK